MSELISEPAAAEIEDTSHLRNIHYARQKRWVLGLMLLWAALAGVIAPFVASDEPVVQLLLSAPIIMRVLKWCLIDADQRGQQVGRGMRIALIVVMLVGLVIYLLRTRGIKGILAVIQALLFTALLLMINVAFEFATLHLGQAAGLWLLE